MARIFEGDNPGQLYMDALLALLTSGKEYAPRGKRSKEIRPVIFEFTKPTNRVTFLKGRVINPFFQVAEALWILAGRSDVNWLTDYNKNIAQFSDDGEYFNAPYGERLRFWGKNDASGFVFNPVDQLYDCYRKLKEDPETRQAVAFIGDPRFDNYDYTVTRKGKDIACNLNIKFKIRDGALHISVDNRSNDLHWGTFGANLAQFATIQEAMASWLGVEVGSYSQVTDSLHMYLDAYGFKETGKVLDAYHLDADVVSKFPISSPAIPNFTFDTEPRMSADFDTWHNVVNDYFNTLDPTIRATATWDSVQSVHGLAYIIKEVPDDYLRMTIYLMMAYQAHKRGKVDAMLFCLQHVPDCSWKVSCLRFLSKKYLGSETYIGHTEDFKKLYSHLSSDIIDYIERKGE